MRARLILTFLSALMVMAWVRAQSGPPQVAPPTFRTSADVVMVDVSVRKGGAQVTGLTAADFELRDNGVKQAVETVESAAIPIDLSIIVDVSGNPQRPWVNLPSVSKVAAGIDEQVRKLTGLLRAGDRVRLFAQDTYVQQIWALQPASAAPPVQHVDFDGQSSLYDTLTTLLLQPVEPTRRHVIVGATRGLDTVSVVRAADVRALAEHSDAQLHLVMLEKAADVEASVRPNQCACMDLCQPTYRFWMPGQRRLFNAVPLPPSCSGGGGSALHRLYPEGEELKAGADATGGGLYMGELLGEPTLFGTFEKAFENFRQSYVLRYSPRGVTREGWHQISVTVPKDGSLKIQARNGYSVDVPAPPAPPAAPPPAANAVLRTLPELTHAYELGGYDSVTRSLRQIADPLRLITEFDEAGNSWPATPRREAALALEIAETGLFSPRPDARDAAQKLLARFALLVRQPIEPDEFERAWLQAELTLLQGTIRPAVARPLIDRALARFPDEPRFLLARAIVTDQFWPQTGRAGGGERSTSAEPSASQISDVVAQYEAAAAHRETAAEARIRLGWFLQRLGRSEEALAHFVGPDSQSTPDPTLRYLRQLFAGHALASLGRIDEAIRAYRGAMTIVPGAQSARVALMNNLLAKGDRAEAATLAEQIQTALPNVIDPWWMYWQGDYRRYPPALAALREFIR